MQRGDIISEDIGSGNDQVVNFITAGCTLRLSSIIF